MRDAEGMVRLGGGAIFGGVMSLEIIVLTGQNLQARGIGVNVIQEAVRWPPGEIAASIPRAAKTSIDSTFSPHANGVCAVEPLIARTPLALRPRSCFKTVATFARTWDVRGVTH